MKIYHVDPKGAIHVTDGLALLTRCGLHPSRKGGWKVDTDIPVSGRSKCRSCFDLRKEEGR